MGACSAVCGASFSHLMNDMIMLPYNYIEMNDTVASAVEGKGPLKKMVPKKNEIPYVIEEWVNEHDLIINFPENKKANLAWFSTMSMAPWNQIHPFYEVRSLRNQINWVNKVENMA